MTLIVQKFGGTSVGSIDRIQAVAEKIATFQQRGDRLVVVVSAMAGETDRLLELAALCQKNPGARESDLLLSTGEQVAIALLAMALGEIGCPAVSYCGWQLPIITDANHTNARIRSIDDRLLRTALAAGKVVVVAGYQGVDEEGNITTLGRGGSDITAVALASSLGADECQIYTDVAGVYTCDPRVVERAQRLDAISCQEMSELASQGAHVLQGRSVELASRYSVPLRVLHSFDRGPGTLISDLEPLPTKERPGLSGIAFVRSAVQIAIRGIAAASGIAAALLRPLGRANITVDMMTQNVAADQTTDFIFVVQASDFDKAMNIADRAQQRLQADCIASDISLCKISLVGMGLRSCADMTTKTVEVLAAEGVEIRMIAASETKISVVVQEDCLERSLRSLHTAFGLDIETAHADFRGQRSLVAGGALSSICASSQDRSIPPFGRG